MQILILVYWLSVGKLTVFKKTTKNMALFVQKLWRKKVLLSTYAKGLGANGLSGLSTRKRTFFAASLSKLHLRIRGSKINQRNVHLS